MRLLLVVFLSTLISFANAQQSDREFAEYYYQNKEFDKAELYFSKLYQEQPSTYYYNRLLTCYQQMEA
ncbi:MAG: hypothetical protein ACPF8V_08500, partial [Luteibaculum sp.]